MESRQAGGKVEEICIFFIGVWDYLTISLIRYIFGLTIFLHVTDPTFQLKISPLSPIPRLALGFITLTVITSELLVVDGIVVSE